MLTPNRTKQNLIPIHLFFLLNFFSTQIFAQMENCEKIISGVNELGISFSKIDENLFSTEPIHPMSEGRHSIIHGNYEGRNAVIKVIDCIDPYFREIQVKKSIQEVKFNQILGNLDLAPKFFGVTQLLNGNIGIISEKIFPSWVARKSGHLKNEIPEAIANVSPEVVTNWIKKMKYIVNEITIKGIKIVDMQFLITPMGSVYIFDLGMFFFTDNYSIISCNKRDLKANFLDQLEPYSK